MSKSFVRAAALCAFVASGAVLAACGGGSVALSTARPSPPPATNQVFYTAIGASDAAGYGASVSCNTAQNPVMVALPSCPGGTGYVPDLSRLLAKLPSTAVTLNDLGISGAVVGPDILALVNKYGPLGSSDQCQPRTQGVDAYPADFITNELPSVTGKETLVTVFAGGNDTNGIVNAAGCMAAGGASTPTISAFLTAEITAFGNDLQSLVLQVHNKAPNAKIYIANLPNFSLIPIGTQQSQAAQQLLATVSVGIDLNVIDKAPAFGVPVIDLLCNPQSYVASNFYTDGFHPNDAGYAAFAQAFYAQITAPTPVQPNTTCSYASQNVVAAAQARLQSAIRDLTRPPHR